MKFVIEHIGKNGGRIGKMSGLRSQPETVHESPFFLVSTLGGSAPHLTQDTFHGVISKETPLCVPAQHFCDHLATLQAFKKGVAHFAALKSHSVCMSVQDPSKTTPSGYNEKKGVSLWTYGGRQLMTSERYMQLVEAMQPDWFESLNDADTDGDSSKKRVAKSLVLSSAMLDECIESYKKSVELQKACLFAPLLGGHSESDRTRWSEAVAERLASDETVGGFSVLGIHTNGPTAEDVTPKLASSLAKSSLVPVPSSVPCQSLGAWNPLAVLSLVQVGIDIFDSTFPFLVTERRGALTFPTSLDSESSGLKAAKNRIEHKDKKFKSDTQMMTNIDIKNLKDKKKDDKENCSDKEDAILSPFEMCLKDESNFLAMDPLVEGCQCYTCKSFSRSYIHHLVNVNEMLAPVLLMMHNLHHWKNFFASIREAIKTDRFDDLIRQIESSMPDP